MLAGSRFRRSSSFGGLILLSDLKGLILADSSAVVSGLAGRYATALFDLAQESKAVDTVHASLKTVAAALAEGGDFARLTTSPLVGRQAARNAVTAVASAMKLDELTVKFLGVLAQNRRLPVLADIVHAFGRLVTAYKGETTAEVISAHALSKTQLTALSKKLKAGLGRDVALEARVDPSILGGLIVKIGSKMIDSSLKTKLDTLSFAMKG